MKPGTDTCRQGGRGRDRRRGGAAPGRPGAVVGGEDEVGGVRGAGAVVGGEEEVGGVGVAAAVVGGEDEVGGGGGAGRGGAGRAAVQNFGSTTAPKMKPPGLRFFGGEGLLFIGT